MILSSYLRELSVKANKRRNNQMELLNLVPNIDFYSTSKNRFVEKNNIKEIKEIFFIIFILLLDFFINKI